MPVSWQIGPESSTAISMFARMILNACEDCVCGVSASDAIDMAARTSGGRFVDVCVISSSKLLARNSIVLSIVLVGQPILAAAAFQAGFFACEREPDAAARQPVQGPSAII